jgi:hypothetical protein
MKMLLLQDFGDRVYYEGLKNAFEDLLIPSMATKWRPTLRQAWVEENEGMCK